MTISIPAFPFRSFWQFVTNLSGKQQNDSAELFNTIYTRYSRVVDSVCFTFARNDNEYDDLRQDAWLNIWRGIDSFRNDAKPSTWIYRVAINSCVSTVRSGKKHTRQQSLGSDCDVAADSPDKDSIDRLHYMLSCLNPIDRSIIMMWLDEREYEDIAHVMGMPRNTIATRVRRIKEKLSKLNNRQDI